MEENRFRENCGRLMSQVSRLCQSSVVVQYVDGGCWHVYFVLGRHDILGKKRLFDWLSGVGYRNRFSFFRFSRRESDAKVVLLPASQCVFMYCSRPCLCVCVDSC
ncbi:unnamed protein product [Ectocarpus sp. 8 AP-2014]